MHVNWHMSPGICLKHSHVSGATQRTQSDHSHETFDYPHAIFLPLDILVCMSFSLWFFCCSFSQMFKLYHRFEQNFTNIYLVNLLLIAFTITMQISSLVYMSFLHLSFLLLSPTSSDWWYLQPPLFFRRHSCLWRLAVPSFIQWNLCTPSMPHSHPTIPSGNSAHLISPSAW